MRRLLAHTRIQSFLALLCSRTRLGLLAHLFVCTRCLSHLRIPFAGPPKKAGGIVNGRLDLEGASPTRHGQDKGCA